MNANRVLVVHFWGEEIIQRGKIGPHPLEACGVNYQDASVSVLLPTLAEPCPGESHIYPT